MPDERVLVDFRTSDDAGVYRWDDESALVQTVDFFTPIVDDPYAYGRIAAANALSDIYAMGGRPLTALAIAAFPVKEPGREVIQTVFRGGFDTLREAGVALLGGHTVQDQEIKFGYAVTGVVDPTRVLSNAGARAGDVVLLTKSIGTGVIGTAIKKGCAPETSVTAAIRSMTTLNRAAAAALDRAADATHACTDITGFGLLGHACEIARASTVMLRIDSARVPLLPGARELALGNRPGGGTTNKEYFGPCVRLERPIGEELELLLFDPQTSGGLLVAASAARAADVEQALVDAGVPAVRVGDVVEAGEPLVTVR